MNIKIKKAEIRDVDLIRSMAEIAFPATYRDILSDDQIRYMMDMMYSPESIESQFREGHVYFIAFMDGCPVGYVSVQQDGNALFHIHKLYVLPEYQGGGYGKQLFQRALLYIKECHPNQCRVELNVNRYNKAFGFYEKLGMSILRQGDFAIGKGYFMNDYIMGLDL